MPPRDVQRLDDDFVLHFAPQSRSVMQASAGFGAQDHTAIAVGDTKKRASRSTETPRLPGAGGSENSGAEQERPCRAPAHHEPPAGPGIEVLE
jgi:hypothetical protein